MNDPTPPVAPPPELPVDCAPTRGRWPDGPDPQFRHPLAAAVLSLFTGLGHVYLGAYERAIAFVLSLVAMFLIGLPFLGLFVYFFAIIDAYRQAQLLNLGEPSTGTPDSAPQPRSFAFGLFLVAIGALLLAHNVLELDLRWLREWWPAALVIAGLWLIVGAVLDRRKRSSAVSQNDTE